MDSSAKRRPDWARTVTSDGMSRQEMDSQRGWMGQTLQGAVCQRDWPEALRIGSSSEMG